MQPSTFKKFKPFHVPKSYVFIDPDTGHPYQATTKEQLFFSILAYREQNDLPPIAALDTAIENYLCNLAENCGSCEWAKLKRGWVQTLRGGVALIENLFYGKNHIVPKEEAERRALICTACPQNIFPDKSAFITWSDEIALYATGGLRTTQYDKLGNCNACTCPLNAKVWYKEASLTEEESKLAPNYCWQLINKEPTK